MSCVLGIDIGTTSTIGILVRLPDRVLAQAARPATLSAPHAGWAEEDPEQWWQNVCDIVPDLIAQAGISSCDIACIGVTGMLPALVVLGKNDSVLRPSIQQSDARCGAEVAEIAKEIREEEFVRKAGNGINQQLVAGKLRWLEKHEPRTFNAIATVFGSYDFINWKLTGIKAIEQNWALEAGFVNLADHELDESLIDIAHVGPEVVPPKSRSHSILGAVTAEAAARTGLAEGTPVVGGAADLIASALGAGLIQTGDVLLKFGGSADILIATDRATPDPRMFLDYHLVPGLFVPNGCMASGGSALNWFVDKIAFGEKPKAEAAGLTIHQHMDQLASEVPAGSQGVQIIPYFLGEKTPLHDPEARGIIHGLSFNHDLRHMWHALLEGFAYAFRHHVEVLNAMGHSTLHYVASDGGSKSRLWMQICANVLERPIQLLDGHPGSCLGAAWTAAIGAGLASDWSGIKRFVSLGDVVRPVAATFDEYDRGYERFRTTYNRLCGRADR